jgi:hypothetical protein
MAVVAEAERKNDLEADQGRAGRGQGSWGQARGLQGPSADGHRALASRAIVANADARAADLAPIIARLDPEGSPSLNELARRLDAEGLPTARGGANWTAMGVARVKARLAR